MEQVVEIIDSQSQSAELEPPELRDGDLYHVFISYSSTDYQLTHSLIDQLESYGLQVCCHERDFIPGQPIMTSMSECIQESQKVLLMLSAEFVRSRWCLMEADMSLLRDCLERKPIIPVLLESGVSIPLHLCHLTHLKFNAPDFMRKLLKVLCTPNQQLQGSTLVPFQPPSIYNGKALQPLSAVNVEGLKKWQCGQFSEMEVPDQLRLVIEDHEKYRRAVKMINDVSQNNMYTVRVRVLLISVMLGFISILAVPLVVMMRQLPTAVLYGENIVTCALGLSFVLCVMVGGLIQAGFWRKDEEKYILRMMQEAVAQANIILSEEKVLMGCWSNSNIYLVYVSLDGCKREFADTFSEQIVTEDMFHKALTNFSSGYACCLSQRQFPFPQPSSSGHLEGGVCFCQYVSQQLSRGQWE